jgi:hypothetical protein
MIVGVTGLIGHGKTYRAVGMAVELARMRGALLAANIKVTAPGVEFVQLPISEDGLDVESVMALVERCREQGRGLVILVDEVGIMMPARWWQKFPIRLLFLLSQSRKHKVDLFWTAQHKDQCDKLLRDLTEYTDRVRAIPSPSLMRRERGKRPWVFRWSRWIGVSVPDASASLDRTDKRIDSGWERYRREREVWYDTDEIIEPPARLVADATEPKASRPRSQRNRADQVSPSPSPRATAAQADPSRVDGLSWAAKASETPGPGLLAHTRHQAPPARNRAESAREDGRGLVAWRDRPGLGTAANARTRGGPAPSLDQRT